MMSSVSNNLLQGGGDSLYVKLAPHLVRTELGLGDVLACPGSRVEHVYFPEDCLISQVSSTADGHDIETSMVGNEGGAGIVEALGSGEALLTMVVQVDGWAWRCPASAFRNLVLDKRHSHDLWRHTEFLLAESRQSTLCVATHPADRRLTRWLLESSDRTGGRNPLPLTQEFLASMLSVRRTTVTQYAMDLQDRGLIQYSRGKVTLLDREGLEARACGCRAFTREQRLRLLAPSPSLSPKHRVG